MSSIIETILGVHKNGKYGEETIGPVHSLPALPGGVVPGEVFPQVQPDDWKALYESGTVEAAPRTVDPVPVTVGDDCLPVTIVPARSWVPTQIGLPPASAGGFTQPVILVGRNEARLDIAVKVFVLTAGTIFIGNSQNLTPSNGWPLMSVGDNISLSAMSDVWAISTSTAQATLAILTTQRDG
jgi:hypothetical protein